MIKTTFAEFCTFDNVYSAHMDSRVGKMRKESIIKFDIGAVEHIAHLFNQLYTGTYRVGRYFKFDVYEPKRRTIYAVPYRDRVVQRMLCDNILYPYFSRKVIADNCGCIKRSWPTLCT